MQEPWPLVVRCQTLEKTIGAVCCALSLLVLISYSFQIESLYRPFAGGAATHPLTALCVMFSSLSIYLGSFKERSILLPKVFSGLTLLIACLPLMGQLYYSPTIQAFIPFNEQVARDLAIGKNNAIGSNTAITFIIIATSLLLYQYGRRHTAQMIALSALFISTVSLTGYLYQLDDFHGEMSILTTLLTLLLSSGALAMTAETNPLRTVLSPYIGGKIARVQILFAFIIPISVGYMMAQAYINEGEQASSFALFVIIIVWSALLMIFISAYYHEMLDGKRRMYEAELVTMAIHDSLTGLYNRKYFFEQGKHQFELLGRTNNKAGIVMLDIDDFKNINDTAGHAVGDRVIVAIAAALKASVRETDILCRLGGEEFVILLINTTELGMKRITRSLLDKVSSTEIEGWTDDHGMVTVSIGCVLAEQGDKLDMALKLADDALYASKRGGKNRASFYVEPETDIDYSLKKPDFG